MSHSQFHCIPFILRHAWLNLWDKHMTTGRINQITILKRPRGSRQVVRFAKVWEIAEAAHDACARRPPPDLCFRDLQPTRPGLRKRASWEAQFASRDLQCKLTASGARRTRSRICGLDWLADTSHTQSYNNLRLPRRGAHIQPVRSSHTGLLS